MKLHTYLLIVREKRVVVQVLGSSLDTCYANGKQYISIYIRVYFSDITPKGQHFTLFNNHVLMKSM